jgi:hypothetical protein
METVCYLQRKFKTTLNYKYAKLSILKAEYKKESDNWSYELSKSEKMDD